MRDKNPDIRKFYELLGLGGGASLSEIKRCARALFLKYHPDLNPDNKAWCEEKTKSIVEAYGSLLEHKRGEEPGGGPDENGAPPLEEEFDVLVFDISFRALAVPTGFVREVVRMKDGRLDNIGMVSDAFPYVAGVFCRGNEVTMLWNLHRQLGLREIPLSSNFERNKVVVVDIDGSAVSFIVDGIRGIVPLRRNSMMSPGSGFEVGGDYLDGVIRTDDTAVGLLNLRSVFYGTA